MLPAVHEPGQSFAIPRLPPTAAAIEMSTIVAAAIGFRPDLQPVLAPLDVAVSGASAGYFLGWAGGFWRSCRQAEGGAQLSD